MSLTIRGYDQLNTQRITWPLPLTKDKEDVSKISDSMPKDIKNAVPVNNSKNPSIGKVLSFAAEGPVRELKADSAEQEKLLKRIGAKECKTCNERCYQDESGDPGVSFKSPAHIDPANAAAAVSAHEQEHVQREQAKAQQEERRIVSQSVRLYTSICPECGRNYVAGGETVTVTAAKAAYNNASAILNNRFESGTLNISA